MVQEVTLAKADISMLRAQRGRISGWQQGTWLVITRELSALTRHLCFLYSQEECVLHEQLDFLQTG
jgi:hypothetical protein